MLVDWSCHLHLNGEETQEAGLMVAQIAEQVSVTPKPKLAHEPTDGVAISAVSARVTGCFLFFIRR